MHTEDWPSTVEEALAVQERLRGRVDLADDCPELPPTVTGLDVAYDGAGGIAAAVVTLETAGLTVVEERTHRAKAVFPYEPGLFAFRELPPLLAALERLDHEPDVLVCDGHGLAHPRRFGLACHLGVLTGRPAFGVAKTRFVGTHAEPASARGSSTALVDAGEEVGAVLRTRDGVKPVYVSAGHRIDLAHACRLTLALTPRYRLPETTRHADRLSRAALR
ncbi:MULTISPECIES: endonuclease V [unclassified Amycolatopsis]|uniref:endonuclease V n=1 Tax=unclassified Amycolatopsis TaxID=2618356 RepID=UPI0028765B0B|nr:MULTISPECIES: endonuclease V [unclassified Amycolatopsis]MDS0137581.1 endonuclease V [Amycolatopsis sp. 505]MDS0141776.1 endonuclease V [Amycolatopsis sp. CM201R]